MGEETSRNCRSWEEDLYWTHFQCSHFSQFLCTGSDQRLAIPGKFVRNLKRKLPDIVTLKNPGGAAWKVGLTTSDDHTVFFNHGWTEFVKDHSLKENDFLIFKYNSESQFEVLMFEGQSMCEKAGSYFVRKSEHGECGCQAKRKNCGRSVEVITTSPNDDIGGSLPDKSTPNEIGRIPLRQTIISQVNNKGNRRENKLLNHVFSEQFVRNEQSLDCPQETETEPDIKHKSLSNKVMRSLEYLSSRRPVTEEEKRNVLQLAQAVVTDEGFVAVMKPTYVYRKYFMSIPSAWMNKHLLPLGIQDVILRVKDSMWNAKFYHHTRRNCGWLSVGWKDFALDNNLDEFDVCVFEPGGLLDNSFVLDVSIFLVVQDATPLIPVLKPGRKSSKSLQAWPHNSPESYCLEP